MGSGQGCGSRWAGDRAQVRLLSRTLLADGRHPRDDTVPARVRQSRWGLYRECGPQTIPAVRTPLAHPRQPPSLLVLGTTPQGGDALLLPGILTPHLLGRRPQPREMEATCAAWAHSAGTLRGSPHPTNHGRTE